MPVDPFIERAIERARSALGVPFRLHGRALESGLDCVGLIAWAYGRLNDVPNGYAMRNTRCDHWLTMIDRFATRRNVGRPCEKPNRGDVVFLHAGPAQYHLGLWTGASLIHADAHLRRVVETPGTLAWPVIATWFVRKDAA
jgi:murein DD-endopeptidase / murein LD-carboxypeptidase